MTRLLLCLLLVAVPLAACKRKPPATPDVEISTAPPNPEADLKALNDGVRAYTMGLLKEPANLEDLVKAGYLKRLPAAPDGKKYTLNEKKSAVVLVAK
mgnify:CR=1 FL=1